MLTPMQRYEWATGPDGWLTVTGWEALADDIEAIASTIGRGIEGTSDATAILNCAGMWDRAADCRARAARLRAS